MKKVLLLFSFFVCTTIAFSQARLGSTEKEIRVEFPFSTFKTYYTDDGIKCLLLTNTENDEYFYYFNKNGYCILTIYIPYYNTRLNAMIENYNKTKVIISDTKWKDYVEGGIVYIQLKWSNDGTRYFEFYEGN